MVNAQEYLNQQDKSSTKLNLSHKELEGEINLTDFTKLRKLDISHNRITKIELGNASLVILIANNNQINRISGWQVSPTLNSLEFFAFAHNNMIGHECYYFSKFPNLKVADIRHTGMKEIDNFNKSSLAVILKDDISEHLKNEFTKLLENKN